MHVDPPDASAVQFAVADEDDDISVRDNWCVIHALVLGQQRLAPALVANEELTVDEIVAAHFIAAEKLVQPSRVWCSVREEPNPYGRVDQDAHAAECRAEEDCSRRRRISRARGSDPRSARRRS